MRYFCWFVLIGGALFLGGSGLSACDTGEHTGRRVEVVAEGGTWSWFSDERAVIVDSSLYVGSVDSIGRVRVTVRSLASSSGRARDTTVRLSSFREVDDHDNPSLLPLGDGRVLAAYAQHHEEPYWYWRIESASSEGKEWSSERRSEDVGAPVTYANLVRLSGEGRLYNFFRGTNFDPTVMTSDDGGATWSVPRHFLRSGGGGTRPYVKYLSDGQDRIDFLYTQGHPRQAETDLYHLYYREGVLYRTDGTHVCDLDADDCLPVPVGEGTRVYDASTAGRGWVWDLEYGEAGTPVAAYVVARDSTVGKDLRYHYARYDADSETWRQREIAHAGTRLYEGENHYAGGIVLDPSDAGRVYVSSDVHPETGAATESGHYQIYEGTSPDRGTTWTWSQITRTETEDNLRPVVPRGRDNGHILLWLQGQYESYTDYNTDVVGRIH